MTPAGSPLGVTVIEDGGEQAPGARDAVTGTGSPPEVSSIVAGSTTGTKSAAATLTTKLVRPAGPPGSPTRTFTTFCPGRAPGRAVTSNDTDRAGGSEATGIVDGVILSSDGSAGNVTVGEPV